MQSPPFSPPALCTPILAAQTETVATQTAARAPTTAIDSAGVVVKSAALLCLALLCHPGTASSKGVIGDLVGPMIGNAVGKLTGQALTPNQLAVKIDELAADINKRGGFPKMIDAETRLDRVSGGPGKKLTYNYTLVNLRANQVNLAALSKFGAGLKAAACASPGSRKILEAGFLLGYAYSATDGYLSSFSVSIFDCV